MKHFGGTSSLLALFVWFASTKEQEKDNFQCCLLNEVSGPVEDLRGFYTFFEFTNVQGKNECLYHKVGEGLELYKFAQEGPMMTICKDTTIEATTSMTTITTSTSTKTTTTTAKPTTTKTTSINQYMEEATDLCSFECLSWNMTNSYEEPFVELSTGGYYQCFCDNGTEPRELEVKDCNAEPSNICDELVKKVLEEYDDEVTSTTTDTTTTTPSSIQMSSPATITKTTAITITTAPPPTCDESWLKENQGKGPMKSNSRIYEGQQVPNEKKWPWMVSLASKLSTTYAGMNYEFKGKCGGSLISCQHILTAKHCIEKTETYKHVADGKIYLLSLVRGKIEIKMMTTVWNKGVKTYDYDDNIKTVGQNEDIAIIILKKKIDKDDIKRGIKPIKLPTKRLALGDMYCVAGYGNKGNVKGNIKLHETNGLKAQDTDTKPCKLKYDKTKELCLDSAKKNNNKFPSTCRGDSGGPGMMKKGDKWYLQGVVSRGSKDCTKGISLIHMDVHHYLYWINPIIK